jgi:hypothetical protein
MPVSVIGLVNDFVNETAGSQKVNLAARTWLVERNVLAETMT